MAETTAPHTAATPAASTSATDDAPSQSPPWQTLNVCRVYRISLPTLVQIDEAADGSPIYYCLVGAEQHVAEACAAWPLAEYGGDVRTTDGALMKFRWSTETAGEAHTAGAQAQQAPQAQQVAHASSGSVDRVHPTPPVRRPTFQNQTDAPPCAHCGAIMVRQGACYKCQECGETSGCG
jgi:hypothetical protein